MLGGCAHARNYCALTTITLEEEAGPGMAKMEAEGTTSGLKTAPRVNMKCTHSCIGSKRQLQSMKKELKGWEAMFERKHRHKPTKVCGMHIQTVACNNDNELTSCIYS